MSLTLESHPLRLLGSSDRDLADAMSDRSSPHKLATHNSARPKQCFFSIPKAPCRESRACREDPESESQLASENPESRSRERESQARWTGSRSRRVSIRAKDGRTVSVSGAPAHSQDAVSRHCPRIRRACVPPWRARRCPGKSSPLGLHRLLVAITAAAPFTVDGPNERAL